MTTDEVLRNVLPMATVANKVCFVDFAVLLRISLGQLNDEARDSMDLLGKSFILVSVAVATPCEKVVHAKDEVENEEH